MTQTVLSDPLLVSARDIEVTYPALQEPDAASVIITLPTLSRRLEDCSIPVDA